MPVYDWECLKCGTVFEAIRQVDETADCPNCGGETKRLISVPGVNCHNEDADWIRSVTEVVDKEGGRAAQEFLKNPTRTNYHNWMREEGIRPFEKGESIKPAPVDTSRIEREVIERHRQRNRIEI